MPVLCIARLQVCSPKPVLRSRRIRPVSSQPAFGCFEAETACREQQHRKKQPPFSGAHEGDLHSPNVYETCFGVRRNVADWGRKGNDLRELCAEVRQNEKGGINLLDNLAIAFGLSPHPFPFRSVPPTLPVGGGGITAGMR